MEFGILITGKGMIINMKKRYIVCTLALAMTVAVAQNTYANEMIEGELENLLIEKNDEEINSKSTPYTLVSSLELDINFSSPINSAENGISLELKKEGTLIGKISLDKDREGSIGIIDGSDATYKIEVLDHKKSQIEEGEENINYYHITFTNLPQGNYNYTLTGEGFNTLSEDISIDTHSKRVKIGSSKNELGYKTSFLLGDVNNDKKVSEEDYNEIYNNRNSIVSEETKKYDLNRDGKIDITDLTYVHKNIGQVIEDSVVEETNPIVNLNEVEVSAQGVTVQEGSTLKDILKSNDTQIKLELENGQPISKENPIEIKVDLTTQLNRSDTMYMDKVIIKASGENAPSEGVITLNGKEYSFNNAARNIGHNIIIDLGEQVAVSEITIKITGSKGNKNLAEIAQVEFLNNVYKEIPQPEMNIPKIDNIKTSTAVHNEKIVLSWNHEVNVTGYEVKVEKLGEGGKVLETKVYQTTDNTLTVSKVDPYGIYRVSMQSLNGEWKSGEKLNPTKEDKDGIPENVDGNYNETGWVSTTGKLETPDSIVEIQVVPESVPEGPEGLYIKGGYGNLNVSWKEHKKAREYKIYYRKIGETLWSDATPDKWLKGTSHTIYGLEEDRTYEVQMNAKNHHGEGPRSKTYIGTTTSLIPPISSNYKVINTPGAKGELTNNIESIEMVTGEYVSPISIADNDYSTHWVVNDWDTAQYSKRGPIITFNDTYELDTIMIATRLDGSGFGLPYYFNVKYWDESGKENLVGGRIVDKKDAQGKWYSNLVLDEPIKTKKLQVNLSVYGGNKVSVSEMKFYHYDSLEKEVKNLFKDDLRIEISDEVTTESIKDLRERANTIDEVSGEYHPNKENLLKEIQRAEEILMDKNLTEDIFTMDTSIQNGGHKIGMNNNWQSTGYTVKSGEEINIYLGTSDTGRKIELGIRQHYGESGRYMSKTYTLQSGKNTITIPKIHSLDAENGGTLYVRTTWDNENITPKVKLRISGAEKTPYLSVNNLINDDSKEAEAKELIREYIRGLKDYVNSLETNYPSKEEEDRENNIYSYDEKTSILNTTDIEGDRFTLTVPATKALEGISSGLTTEDEQVERLYNSLKAWEQLMEITYAKKGVYEEPIDFNDNGEIDNVFDETTGVNEREHFNTNRAPRNRMNIKYQRMFTGAFMYASSDHIGVEGGSVPALMQGMPYEFDDNGNITNPDAGNLFGWGISHEIGHVVDIGKRTYSETSNNILSLLTQTFDGKDHSRLEDGGVYERIYHKVTSQTLGLPSDVFTQLGMFWQLHLAYDSAPTSAIIINNIDTDISNDSYFTKMNRLYRTLPSEMQNLDKDQLLIRIASDTAGRDLREFFLNWGIVADENTNIYLTKKGYERETRKIWYLNDEARRQVLSGIQNISADTSVQASFDNGIIDGTRINDRKVDLTLDVTKEDEKILGYEIIVNGEPSAFVERDRNNEVTKYSYMPETINNRTLSFEVVAYDYNLNATEKVDLGTIKISHDGSIAKNNWIIDTNMNTGDVNNSEDTTGPVMNSNTNKIKDNDVTSVFEGTKKAAADPYVIVDIGEEAPIVGLRYTTAITENTGFISKMFNKKKVQEGTIKDYVVEVSEDGTNWTKVKNGVFDLSPEKTSQEIFFNKEGVDGGNQYWMHNVKYLKLTAKGATAMTIAELDILSPTGDNIEIGVDNNDQVYENGIGILKNDYVYAEGKMIPKGSLIVTGEYKGNPAFNIPLILDEKNENIAYNAKAILLAEVPENSVPTEIAEGNYVYFIEPENLSELTAAKIKGELYRVNDPATLQGQRLVSDTFYIQVPEVLPEIDLKGGTGERAIQEIIEFEELKIKEINEGRAK